MVLEAEYGGSTPKAAEKPTNFSLFPSLGPSKSSHIAFRWDDVNTLFSTQCPAIPEAQLETAPSTDETSSPFISSSSSQLPLSGKPCLQPHAFEVPFSERLPHWSILPTFQSASCRQAPCYIPNHIGAPTQYPETVLKPFFLGECCPHFHICMAKQHPDFTANFNAVSP